MTGAVREVLFRTLHVGCAVAGIGALGCGGSDSVTGSSSMDSGSAQNEVDGSARSRADSGTVSSELHSSCPGSLPRSGDACSDIDLACEYGADDEPRCNVIASCVQADGSTTWRVPDTSADDSSIPCRVDLTFNTPQAGCPAARPRIGSECDGRVRTCLYNNCDPDGRNQTAVYVLMNCEAGIWQVPPDSRFQCPAPS